MDKLVKISIVNVIIKVQQFAYLKMKTDIFLVDIPLILGKVRAVGKK